MKENTIEKLAKISTRAQLEDEIKWSNSTYYLKNITFVKLLCFFFTYLFTQNYLFSRFIRYTATALVKNKINKFFDINIIEVLIDISLLVVLWFALTKLNDYYLASNPRYLKVDCFDPNMLEEECNSIRKQLKYEEKQFYCYQILFAALEINSFGINCISMHQSIKKLIIATNVAQTGIIANAISKLGYFVLKIRKTAQPSEFCDLINKIFLNSNISFSLSKGKDNYLELDHILFSFVKPAILLRSIFAFKVTKFPNKCFKNCEQYYLMILIKKNIEELLNLEVPAIDDHSFLINLSNIYKKDLTKLQSKANIINTNMNIFFNALNRANRKIITLNSVTKRYTDKSWKKIFNQDDKNFFSFSLTIKDIKDSKLRDRLIIELKELYFQANIYTFASKLVIEGDTTKTNNNKSLPLQAKCSIPDMEQNYNEYTSKNKNSLKKKIKPPKIVGLHRYLFLRYKQPALLHIQWDDDENPTTNISSYYPLSHGCTNKITFYCIFTLSEDFFTPDLTKDSFIGILKSQVIKSAEATGSCIKFLTHDERENLKKKIQNYANSEDIILKLHRRDNVRVYGKIIQTGTAEFDDGTKINVKLIDFCIVDHESHKKNSSKIYFSNRNSSSVEEKSLTIRQ